MIPHWFERWGVLILLLLAMVLRTADLSRLPLGLSTDDVNHIIITEKVRDAEIRVFFGTQPTGGEEILYPALNTGVTSLVGKGLFGYRVLGLWASLLALAFLYRATRGLFGPSVALVALAIMVTDISSVLLARNVTSYSIIPLFVTASLAVVVWTFRLHEPISPSLPKTTPYTVLGFLIGMAVYVHYMGLMLGLGVLLFAVYLWRTRQPLSRQVWGSAAFSLTLILITALPYLISFLRTPDLSGIAIFWDERPRSALALGESFLATIGGFLLWGDADPTHNVPSLPMMWLVWTLLAGVGLISAVRRWREPAYGLLLIWLALGILPDVWLRGGPNFTALLVAQPILFVLAGLGAYVAGRYVQVNGVPGGWRLVAVVIGLGLLVTVWQVYEWYLTEWGEREDVQTSYHTDVGQLMAYLNESDDTRPVLLCVDTLQNQILPNGNIRWGEPQLARYMLQRDDLDLHYAVCRSSFVFVNGGEPMRVLLVNPRQINEASTPIRNWLDRLVPIRVENLPTGVVTQLDAEDDLAQLGGQLQAESNVLYPRSGSEYDRVELPVRFGRNITLLGARLPADKPYHPGDVLAVTSYWRVDGDLPSRLGIFTRLHDTPQSSPYTETNTLDVVVSRLSERDVFVQTNFMAIPDTLLAGEYVVTLGAFDNNPLNQVPVFETETTEIRGDYVILGDRIQVQLDPDN